MFLIIIHVSFLKSHWHLYLLMWSPYFLGMHLTIGVDYGETFSLNGEGAQGWFLWETMLSWDQHLILSEVQIFQWAWKSVREYSKKNELSLLHPNQVLAHRLSTAGISDNILQLSILKEENWERKGSIQKYVVILGSYKTLSFSFSLLFHFYQNSLS